MKIIDIARRAGRSLRSAKMRTFLTATAIGIGGFTLIITLAATNGARSYVDNILQENFDPAELFVYRDKSIFGDEDKSAPKEYNESGVLGSITGNSGCPAPVALLTPDDIETLKKADFTESVTPVIRLSPEFITRNGQKKYTGSFEQLGSRQNLSIVAGKAQVESGKRQVILPEPFVTALGFKNNQDALGKRISVGIRESLQASPAALESLLQQTAGAAAASLQQQQEKSIQLIDFTVVGVKANTPTQQPGTEFSLYTDYRDLQSIQDSVKQGQPDYRSTATAVVRVKNGDSQAAIESAQQKIAALGLQSKSSKDLQKLINSFISTLQIVIIVFSIITVVASVFGIVNTLYISVLERTREIGLMKALGMRRRGINLLFIFEAMLIGLIGGAMGVLAGYTLGTLVNPVINKKLELPAGVSLLEFKPAQMVLLVGALMLVAMLAGLLPARKASKLDPIEALRTE